MKFHFFVLATCITRQNEQTTKRNGRKTKNRKTNKRQNEQVTTTNQTFIFRGNFVVLSFRRAVGKATKRTNEEMKSNSSFWRLVQRDKTNKRRNEILIFRFRVFRFGALTNATKRRNEEMKFHFYVLATCTTRQNEQTKK